MAACSGRLERQIISAVYVIKVHAPKVHAQR